MAAVDQTMWPFVDEPLVMFYRVGTIVVTLLGVAFATVTFLL